MNDDALRREILELGLEDDIPLWEIADACRTDGLIAAGSPGVDVLAASLVALARTGEIRIRVGRWDDPDTRDADIEEAEPLLNDPRRYSSAEEIANGLERVYYVNVDNIVE
ncbi:hypothetical protein [Phycicoccus duodecadis]|uniref:Uncharacterized protein n=1 Tax=Phycicoccus duodecadis TaxID=173053 RepID=A0A2N3YKD3_9MICO|nr:hypothetical protein [Phycicoccus duodecadis]PKW27311.1 hypothetical protein ATL31_2149 [Phycicoccus duodecadis]